MSSKRAKYIEVPLVVLNIGLLYAFLLTMSQLLAWTTIARHEKTIEKLKEMMVERRQEKQSFTSAAVRSDAQDAGNRDINVTKLLAVKSDTGQRPRRHLKPANTKKAAGNSQQQQLKGDKGDKGVKGDRGERGYHGLNGLNGRDGRTGQQGIRGERGDTGIQGPRGFVGSPAPQGIPGPQGSLGIKGDKGEKGLTGSNGSKGVKGERGNNGPPGKVVRHPNSAHIVGSYTKGAVKSTSGSKLMSSKVKWKVQHKSGNMHYNNGYITIGMDGIYFVYSQMFYAEGISSFTGYQVRIDNKIILKAVHSVPNKRRKIETQYTSGIFKISKGQRISVETPFAKMFYFDDTMSFFGAFMLHD